MVYVPLLNIELPEPRLHELVPGTVEFMLRATSKLAHVVYTAIYPVPPELDDQVWEALEAAVPREFDRVMRRHAEGRIKNSDQLESEIEDASYDWYRRMLRTNELGGTSECQEDVTARHLGLGKPGAQQEVVSRFAEENPELFTSDLAEVLGVEDEGVRAAIAESVEQEHLSQLVLLKQAKKQEQDLAMLKRRVKPGTTHFGLTSLNVAVGVGIGLGMVKGCAYGLKRLLKSRAGKAKKASASAAVAAAAAAKVQARKEREATQQQQQPAAAEAASKRRTAAKRR